MILIIQGQIKYVSFIMLTLFLILSSSVSSVFGSINHDVCTIDIEYPRNVLIGKNVSLIVAVYINDTIANTSSYKLFINITYITNNDSIEHYVKEMKEYYLVSFIPQNVGAYVVKITVEITGTNSNISRTKYAVINAYKQNYDDIISKLKDIDEKLNLINQTLIKINNSLTSQLNQIPYVMVSINREVVKNISKDVELLTNNVSILSKDIVDIMNHIENNSEVLVSRLDKLNKTLLDLIKRINDVKNSTNHTLDFIKMINQSISASIAYKYSILDNKLGLMTKLAGLSMGSVLLLIILFTLGMKKVVH